MPFEWYKKVDIPIEYDASVATGALTSIRSNNIFLVTAHSNLADNTYIVSGSCRLRFVG